MSLIVSKPRLLYSVEKRVVLFHQQQLQVVPFTEFCPTCGKPSSTPFVDDDYFTLLRNLHTNTFSTTPDSTVDSEPEIVKGYYDTFFIELQKLGRGLRGSVYLVQHTLDETPLGLFAVKAIPVGHSHEWTRKMLREVMLLTRLRHDHIIQYRHAWIEERQLNPFVPNVPCLFILMEYANGGDVESFVMIQEPQRQTYDRDRLYTLKTTVSPSIYQNGGIGFVNGHKVRLLTLLELESFLNDITMGVLYLHSLGVLHRDLKPQNLLLIWDEDQASRVVKEGIPRVVISDFGECQRVDEHLSRTGFTGTLDYVPPELLTKTVNENGTASFLEHSESSDIWALGLVFYFLCYSSLPYQQSDDVDLLRKEIEEFDTSQLEMLDHRRVKPGWRRLIVDMLHKDPSMRPTISQVEKRLEMVDQLGELEELQQDCGSTEVIRCFKSKGGLTSTLSSIDLDSLDMLRQASENGDIHVQDIEVDGLIVQRRTRKWTSLENEDDIERKNELLKETVTMKLENMLQWLLTTFQQIPWTRLFIYTLPLIPYLFWKAPSLMHVMTWWSAMLLLLWKYYQQ
jgi:serine/threonine protein kinase